jgi:3-methyladenine DNA glycosylase/8-oxoguanine DNA glycosylase
VLLPLPEPYDFALSLARFRAWGTDLANRFDDGSLHRFLGGREVRIAPVRGGVDVAPLDPTTGPLVEKLLGLEFDLPAFYAFAAGDPVLGGIAWRLAGLRPPVLPDPFEMLVTSITAQQVSLYAAVAIRNRLIERFGAPGRHAYAFPSRETLAEASEPELVAVGLSRRKAEYVVGLARDPIELEVLADAPDDEVRARLGAIRGLGPWTAEWFLARHLARPRAWPAGDLSLRQAVDLFYGSDVDELGRRLDPFQNLSAQYLLTAFRMQ